MFNQKSSDEGFDHFNGSGEDVPEHDEEQNGSAGSTEGKDGNTTDNGAKEDERSKPGFEVFEGAVWDGDNH